MKKRVFIGVVSIGISMACQAQWFDQRLNDGAATNALGQMIVLCDDGGYLDNNPIYAPERAFDGDVNTFYDANWAQGAWLGIKLEKPKIVTRVSYTGRQGWTGRIGGTLVQGANQSDFSDAVTLGTLNVPNANDWNGLSWRTENLPSPAALQTYTFVRLYCNAGGSYGGNFSGIEFYGCDPDVVPDPPADPTVTLNDCVNWRFNLRWDGDADAMMYEVQRKLDDEPDFSPIAEHYYLEGGRKEWYDASLLLFCETQYRIRALNPMGASGWTTLTNTPLNAARGVWLGTPGSYNNGGATGAVAFDGIIWTSFDAPNASDGNNAWTGLDLGAPREIVALRFLPRFDYPDRMNGGVFEAADNPDFLNATLLHTVEGNPPNTGVTEAPVPTPVTARYVRYCSPNGGWGNVAEAEFVLTPSAPNAPTGLRVESVSMMDTTNAVLTWSLSIASVVSSSKIYRATSPGGPYTCLTPDGVFGRTWTDTGLATGTLYYYRVSALLDTAGGPLEGEMSAYATYAPAERLERDWADLTQIKYAQGMSLIGDGNPWGNDHYVDVNAMFDNDLGSYVDTSNPIIGIDLAKPYCISLVRFAARNGFPQRLNGAVLCGSNDPGLSPYTILMTFQGAIPEVLVAQQTVSLEPFRHIFIQRLDGGEFFGNINELELYGWDPTQVPPPFTSPTALEGALMPNGAVALSWQGGQGQDAYRVERRAAGSGGGWAVLTPDTPSPAFTDTPPLGQTYEYRVAAVRGTPPGEETAYSDPCLVTAYIPGGGEGLTAHYYAPYYRSYSYDEQLIWSGTEPPPDWSLPDGGGWVIKPGFPQTASDVRITWYGDIEIPFGGDYTFYLTSDDGAALTLGGETLINAWADRGTVTDTATRALTGGVYRIRLDYFQGVGGKTMRLEWGGAVARQVIPATQLYPRLDLPEGGGANLRLGDWEGRTFDMPHLGFHRPGPAGDGFTLGAVGADLTGGQEGYHFLWQKIRGDFIFEAKVEMDIDPLRPDGKAMLMCRNELPTRAPFLALACAAYTPEGRLNVKFRTEQNADVSDVFQPWVEQTGNPCHLRIKRAKGVFEFFYRNPGETGWTPLHTFLDTEAVFAQDLYVGFAVTSPIGASLRPLQEATFSDITLKKLNGTVILLR